MSRFGGWRGTQRSGWSGTARVGHSLPTSPGNQLVPPVLTPDGDSRLSDGVVIEMRLRARLLGAPVLKVDGTVHVSPARLVAPRTPPVVRGAVVQTTPKGSGAAPRSQVAAPGSGLAEATRLLEESRQRLRRQP